MSQVHFIADTHFGHRNICKYRSQFASTEDHDKNIILRWNSKIRKKDIVYVLGDFLIHNDKYDMYQLVHSLNGNIRVITGNHDYTQYYYDLNIPMVNGLLKKYGYWLSHAPIHPSELRGHKNIHGHIHDKHIDDENYINVCCEHINYTPISLDEIRSRK